MMKFLYNIFITLGFWTYPIVGIELFLESSAFIGIIFPGDSVVILMGVLAGTKVLPLWTSIILIVCCVFAGDVSGYLLGRYKGEAILKRSNWAKRKYERHYNRIVEYQKHWGTWIVVIGRFLPVIRSVMPFTMGMGAMTLPRFLPAAALASVAWCSGFFVLGYEFGSYWKQLESILKPAGEGLITAIVLGIGVWYWWRHPRIFREWFAKLADWLHARAAGAKSQ